MRIRKLINQCKELFSKDKSGLFHSPPQIREHAVVWRLLNNLLFFSALSNGTWKWFATEVPYRHGKDYGEIDILLCKPESLEQNPPLTYKGFQVKVSLIDKHDKEHSSKSSAGRRFRKALGQLKRLRSLGCDRVCLLEVIVFEQDREASYLPKKVASEINRKAGILARERVGYVVMPVQFIPGVSEDAGGYWHNPINVLPATKQDRGPEFLELANQIDTFFENSVTGSGKGLPVVNYCKKCKKYGIVHTKEHPLICPECKVAVI